MQTIIDKTIRVTVRFVLGERKFDNFDKEMNLLLNWLNAKSFCRFENLKLAFKIVKGNSPSYFVNYLNLEKQIYNLKKYLYANN